MKWIRGHRIDYSELDEIGLKCTVNEYYKLVPYNTPGVGALPHIPLDTSELILIGERVADLVVIVRDRLVETILSDILECEYVPVAVGYSQIMPGVEIGQPTIANLSRRKRNDSAIFF